MLTKNECRKVVGGRIVDEVVGDDTLVGGKVVGGTCSGGCRGA